MASVRVENKAHSDWRFRKLGRLCLQAQGAPVSNPVVHHRLGIGIMVEIWNQCTESSSDQQTGDMLDELLGGAGTAGFLVEADLAENLGDGTYRIRGATEKRIGWMEELSSQHEKKAAGGKRRAAGARRNSKGRFLKASSPAVQQPSSSHPAEVSRTPPAPPATLSLTLSLPDLSSSSKKSAEPKKKQDRTAPEGYCRFIDEFTAMYQAARGAKPTWGAKQGAQVKRLLVHGADEALARAKRMFEHAPAWPAENPDLATLVAHFDKFAPPVPRKRDVRVGYVPAERGQAYPDGEVAI